MERSDVTHLGEPAVYPGHPITVALCIVHAFPTYEHATAKGREFTAALESSKVPGSGGCVASALLLLRSLHAGTDPAEAIRRADDTWSRCDGQKEVYPDRWRKGQEQADRFKDALLARRDWWGTSAMGAT